jgi:serine/threonine protein kinase
LGIFGSNEKASPNVQRAPNIGGWEIEKKIGQGGFGTVFLGFKKLPGNQGKLRAAVKVINSDLRDQDDYEGHVARFLAEFKILRELDNPNCARVLEADVKSANPWMATQFVSGDSLHDEVRHEGPLTGALWWFLARDVLLGLSEAHTKGIVHRDIKPQNIMRGSRGSVLIDFGIAKMAGNPKLTVKGAPMTPAFASPEQLEGKAISTASDIFSLGHTLLFAASNRLGYKSDSLQSLMTGILTADPDLSGIPADIKAIIGQMMSRNPSSRPTAQSALRLCERALSTSEPTKNADKGLRKPSKISDGRGVGNIRVFTPKAPESKLFSLRDQAKKIEVKISPSSGTAVRKPLPVTRTWKDLDREIVNFLVRAGSSQFVLPFSSGERNEIYFQGFFDDEGRVTIEAVSNQFLNRKLSDSQHQAMISMGWEPPTEGLPNYIQFLDFEASKKSRLSKLILDSLRDGYLESAESLEVHSG